MEIESKLSSEFEVRRKKLEDLKKSGINPYPARFNKNTKAFDLIKKFSHLKEGEADTENYKIAGRILSKRDHGKSCFAHIYDGSDKIQIYVRLDTIGENKFEEFLKLDIGDFIGIEGNVFRTHKGELSLQVKDFTILAKALRNLPEKFHGLKDAELRYRKRYLDLITSPETKKIFITRSKIINSIRNFLDKNGFLEVETPVLSDIAGGATARPFSTYHNTYEKNLFLRIALELPLKKLIIGGFEKVYEIGRVFRNEGVSYKHNPEYTLLELYEAYGDYLSMMKLCEEMIIYVTREIKGSLIFNYQGKEINLTPPWPKITMAELILKHTGIDILKSKEADLQKFLLQEKIEFPKDANRGALIELIYEKKVEPNLIQPIFIYNYPVETSPLAKKTEDNPNFTERFELIISGMEIANAFSELNDPIDQRARFEEQVKQKSPESPARVDEDFLEAMEHGMPPTGGLGIGIDRLVMLLTDTHSIREVLLFPYMKPLE